MPSRPLAGQVAVVAGATRGAGRGIAVALGEQGATVYCTGRSARGAPSPMARPETIEETAERVTQAGGEGIAARVDHLDEAQVQSLFARVEREQGRLDVLVNDIWGADPLIAWGRPFWEQDVGQGLAVLRQAVHTHLITARHGVPSMVRARRGLLVEVTDGDTMQYRGTLYYDLVKTTVLRLAWDFAEELRPHGVAAVAVTPGFLRSEAMLDHFGVTEPTWREAGKQDPNFLHSETPLFVGRAVAALAQDPRILARSGRVFASWTLAKEYGFADADGARPDWGAHFARAYGQDLTPPLDDAYYRYLGDHARLAARFEQGA
jgi:NAD(P)-dependent dehydrogenase (short-subunit alcohol dehydrogenase family)